MQNQWLAEELKKIMTPDNQFVLNEALRYIEQLEDDNESLQVALEGTIWSPKKWRDDQRKSEPLN